MGYFYSPYDMFYIPYRADCNVKKIYRVLSMRNKLNIYHIARGCNKKECLSLSTNKARSSNRSNFVISFSEIECKITSCFFVYFTLVCFSFTFVSFIFLMTVSIRYFPGQDFYFQFFCAGFIYFLFLSFTYYFFCM